MTFRHLSGVLQNVPDIPTVCYSSASSGVGCWLASLPSGEQSHQVRSQAFKWMPLSRSCKLTG